MTNTAVLTGCTQRETGLPGSRYFGSAGSTMLKVLFFLMLSAPAGAAWGQGITVTFNGKILANGGSASLAAIPGPTILDITPYDVTDCDETDMTIQISYTDASNPDGGSYANALASVTGPYTTEADLGYSGGYGTIVWQVNGGDAYTFTFTILGTNPSHAQTDSEITSIGSPWFFGQLIRQENQYNQFRTTGLPWVNANPDGVGISQVDGTKQSVTTGAYWDWESNLSQGLSTLNGGKSTSYAFYAKQVSEATSAHPPPVQTQGLCTFSGSPTGSQHNWQDADWMNTYVGTGSNGVYAAGYYISWTGTNATNGTWHLQSNAGDSPRSYVGDVCKNPAF